MTLIREELVKAEIAAAKHGIREVGANNHGPMVKKFLAEVGLPEGYAWCDAFQSFEEHAVAGHRLPIESASVWQTHEKARELGWLVGHLSPKLFPTTIDRDPRPCRGDLVLYDFNADGKTDDHIGIVVARTVIPGGYHLTTVEGNTGDGSAADGDGVYLRERSVSRTNAAYVRIPGVLPDPPKAKPAAAKPKPAATSPAHTGAHPSAESAPSLAPKVEAVPHDARPMWRTPARSHGPHPGTPMKES